MPDATIKKIVPVINMKRGGGNKHHSFGIEGTNLDAATTVKVTYNGEEMDLVATPHGTGNKLLYIKVKRKPGPEKPPIRQLEQITVTVTNPGQTTPGSNTPDVGTHIDP